MPRLDWIGLDWIGCGEAPHPSGKRERKRERGRRGTIIYGTAEPTVSQSSIETFAVCWPRLRMASPATSSDACLCLCLCLCLHRRRLFLHHLILRSSAAHASAVPSTIPFIRPDAPPTHNYYSITSPPKLIIAVTTHKLAPPMRIPNPPALPDPIASPHSRQATDFGVPLPVAAADVPPSSVAT